jgi:hypothetical protein
MRTFRELATEFIAELGRRNEESQKQIDQIEATGMRIGEKPYGGSWSDITDREVASLKQDIASRARTIARLEEEVRDSP